MAALPSTPQPNPQSSRLPLPALAMLLPLLPFTFLSWQNIASKFNFPQVSSPKVTFSSESTHIPISNTSAFQTMASTYATACPQHNFKTHIFSTDPLIIYLENYLSHSEAAYLLHLATPYYRQSPVSKGYDLETYDREIRSSMSAVVPDDPVVSCIERRSVDFQGYMPVANLEDIQVVKYGVSDHFRPHFDWFSGMKNPRVSTFFVYLACDDEDGTEGKSSSKHSETTHHDPSPKPTGSSKPTTRSKSSKPRFLPSFTPNPPPNPYHPPSPLLKI
ncbi:hypothetical protein GRF29_216g225057 [Pseudopithomyces chartarum]|uniref:Prolyl 4-hydroxylase alpha subunit domain-containing protein n=1 Tax=Pseudopithomyces chartarum TaxID=1892770 RepID=A0AAN6RE00_9PLEO|nr:hypothetical protein GRF29_216g225057 [Pseudopithomyces chartarum]